MGFRKRKTSVGRRATNTSANGKPLAINWDSSSAVKAALLELGVEPAHGSGSLAVNVEKLHKLGYVPA